MASHAAAVRVLRSAPAVGLEQAAASAGVSVRTLRAALRSLPARGRCGAAAGSLARRGRVEDRMKALAHTGCPPPVARIAATSDPSAVVRSWVAGTAGWRGRAYSVGAPRCLYTTVEDTDFWKWIVSEVSVPPAMLAVLAGSSNPLVRYGVSTNSRCFPATLAVLSTDLDTNTRIGVAEHRCTPAVALAALRSDHDTSVRNVVRWGR